MTAFALVLLLGAAAAWIAAGGAPLRTRAYLRLAAVLYAALAVSEAANVAAAAVTDIAATLGSAVLGVAAFSAFRRAPHALTASLVLLIAAICSIAAAATDWRALAAAPQLSSAIFIFVIARPGLWKRPSLYLALAALSLLCAAALELVPGAVARAGLLLFAAAGVLGVALASDVLVENGGAGRRTRAIRRAR
jgi:hypothetical protein